MLGQVVNVPPTTTNTLFPPQPPFLPPPVRALTLGYEPAEKSNSVEIKHRGPEEGVELPESRAKGNK